jgi:CopG family transcriptional regulator/antitoxin EndoAI
VGVTKSLGGRSGAAAPSDRPFVLGLDKTLYYSHGVAYQRTVTISLPPGLAQAVDRLAQKEGRTRSELLREAFRQYASRAERWDRVHELGRGIAARRGLTEADADRVVKEERRVRAR